MTRSNVLYVAINFVLCEGCISGVINYINVKFYVFSWNTSIGFILGWYIIKQIAYSPDKTCEHNTPTGNKT